MAKSNFIQSAPEWVWVPFAAALLICVPGAVGILAGMPFLFPSLAPSAVLQASHPDRPSSHFYSVVVAHFLGFASASLIVWLFGLLHDSAVLSSGKLTVARVVASELALALASVLEILLKARHPAAAATTLLVALGSFKPTLHDAGIVAAGVLILAGVGEGVRRLRLPPVASRS